MKLPLYLCPILLGTSEKAVEMAFSSWTYLSQTTYSFQDRKGYADVFPREEKVRFYILLPNH